MNIARVTVLLFAAVACLQLADASSELNPLSGLLNKVKGGAKATKDKIIKPPNHLTPCTNYNDVFSNADNSCNECTTIRFTKKSIETGDYVMVTDRTGHRYPLKKFIRPAPKRDATGKIQERMTCMWCPEKQLCGHPIDKRVTCPDGFSKNDGWLRRQQCVDTQQSTNDRIQNYENQEDQALKGVGHKERIELKMKQALTLEHRLSTRARELAAVSWADALHECSGQCVRPGEVSECSKNIKRAMPKNTALPVEKDQILYDAAFSDAPVPCKITVPATEQSPRKAYGVYTTLGTKWRECRLVMCTPPPPVPE